MAGDFDRRSSNGVPRPSPRDETPRTPSGPEGSSGSGDLRAPGCGGCGHRPPVSACVTDSGLRAIGFFPGPSRQGNLAEAQGGRSRIISESWFTAFLGVLCAFAPLRDQLVSASTNTPALMPDEGPSAIQPEGCPKCRCRGFPVVAKTGVTMKKLSQRRKARQELKNSRVVCLPFSVLSAPLREHFSCRRLPCSERQSRLPASRIDGARAGRPRKHAAGPAGCV